MSDREYRKARNGGPGRPVDPAAVLAARRESERRRQASLREDAASRGGGNFSMVLRAADAEALAKICKRDGITRSAAVRAALAAYSVRPSTNKENNHD